LSRLLESPVPTQVGVVGGIPANAVIASGVRRPVLRVCGRWRVESDWWRTPISREYWKLELGGPAEVLCDLYRDCLTGDWWLSRLYD
jgi:hypothetical protein